MKPLHMHTSRNYFRAVESYIPFEADLADFLANVRANYDLWIKDGNSLKVATASVEGTLLATLKEVHSLLMLLFYVELSKEGNSLSQQ